eukprot:TRINITY_DN11696_c0_g1_i1.p1 TRINITY_DN11696_c0_g1~~TRINITY_DN11696_c0_g1_i1.p1  ORF type:complete len:245 (-),score=88.93 TRINITY_DN11696_c0_g1_i1:130-864(-)
MTDINTSTEDGLVALNTLLLSKSYVEGWKPTQLDAAVHDKIAASRVDAVKYPHLARWYTHISSFTCCQKATWVIGKKEELKEQKAAIEETKKEEVIAAAPKAEAKTEETKKEEAPVADDDDWLKDVDEEDREREKIMAERAAVKIANDKAKGKKKDVDRSTLILDIKPEGEETDLKALEAKVRSITKDGLVWKGSELFDVIAHIKAIRIISVIEDLKISTDELREEIEALEGVQSTDIYAFNKV